MKNNIKVIKNPIIFFIIFSFFQNTVFAEKEIFFEAKEINSFSENNLIIGKGEASIELKDEIKISAEEFIYNKKDRFINAKKKVKVYDYKNKILINSNYLVFDQKKNNIISYGDTQVYTKDGHEIFGSDIEYNIQNKNINSRNKTVIIDNKKNIIETSSIDLDEKTNLFSATEIKILDEKKNIYFLKNGKVDLNKKRINGKDVEIQLYENNKNIFRLKGNSLNYEDDITKIQKGIFTSCEKNENCPPWSITAEQITHNKKKSQIEYENAVIRIYDIPTLYFPKFFHPDPSVDRKSGFLTPSFRNSKNVGSSINLPYFSAISQQSDFTFNPRLFSDSKFLLQTEYRKLYKNSSHIIDTSLNNQKNIINKGTSTHFFLKSNFELDKLFLEDEILKLKIQKVSNDEYIDKYSIHSTSFLVENKNILENSIEYSASKDDLDFDFSFFAYETLYKKNSDRYEFVYPNYTISKNFYPMNSFFDNLNLISSGNQKKYSTNINEIILINDFNFSSSNFENKLGLNQEINGIIKNVNSKGKNSDKLKDDKQSEVLSLLSYDVNLPLIKESKFYKDILIPQFSLRYSPNDSKNIKNSERLLNSENVFSLNRIGFSETLETGTNLTIGLNFEKNRAIDNKKILSSKIATVFRKNSDENLPSTSTLNKKQSDIVGNLTFDPIEQISLNYDYSINNNLNDINLHKLDNTIKINNFINKFTFYEENNILGNNSYYENTSSLIIDNNNTFSFKTRENKKDNLTEFYNLIYEYKNDCLTASIIYNKEFYTNSSLEPKEELLFNITLIPIGGIGSTNMLK